jgi:hypothetical protein
MLLNALATPVAVAQPLPGERAALEAFREQHLVGRRRGSVRIRRSAGAVAAGVGLFLASGTAAAAATGVLPDPAQHVAHAWFERVGISVPDAGGFIERSSPEDQRSAQLPDQARLSVTPPSLEDFEPLQPVDLVSGTTSPPARVGDPRTREKQAHGAPPATYPPPSPEPAGQGSTQQSTPPAAPAPPATPAVPPNDPPAGPPANPNTTPPATPADQAQRNQDRRRDPAMPPTPTPNGASPPEAPPAAQTDLDSITEETTQRRTR